jgi:uncharacterized protein (DUF1330 family)
MPSYLISEVSEVLDSASMEKYRTLAETTIKQYGGRYIVRGGSTDAIEGEWPAERIVVVEFPSVNQAKVWYQSPEYAKALELSRVALKRRMVLLDGIQAQTSDSRNYLDPLATAHFVVGGLGYLVSFLPVLHIAMGIYFIINSSEFGTNGSPPAFFGWIFVILGVLAILAGLALSTCILVAGFLLRRRKHYWICFALACVECIVAPFGTILGVLTIVTLCNDSAKSEFPGLTSGRGARS